SDVLRARDAVAREFFAQPRGEESAVAKPVSESGAYLRALAALLPWRGLAIDAGTGEGGLLDVLAPTFERVVAVDRSEVQLRRARERAAARGYDNVSFVEGELDAAELLGAVGDGADAVFAARVLHHAARPGHVVK